MTLRHPRDDDATACLKQPERKQQQHVCPAPRTK
jgi:hypothetical protein